MSRRMRAVPVYLTYLACSGFFFQMMSVVFSLFLILRLDLGPFQLVLLGTILEGTYLLFETPTGVVADTIGRRASVIADRRVGRAPASLAPAVPSRHPQGNGGHAGAGRDGPGARSGGRAGLTPARRRRSWDAGHR